MPMQFDPFKPEDLSSETEFEAAVKLFGGLRITDLLGADPAFKNADWAFPRRRAIVEHKELKANFVTAPSFQESEILLRLKYIEQGKANLFGSPKNPEAAREFANDYIHLYRKPLRRIVESASKQLRESRKQIGWKIGRNILVLSNRSLTEILPLGVCIVLEGILTDIPLNIDGIAYVTHHYVDIPGSDLANVLWLPVYSREHVPKLATIDFVDRFGEVFLREVGRSRGDPPESYSQQRSGTPSAMNVLRGRPIKPD